jgi:hypothetical protein
MSGSSLYKASVEPKPGVNCAGTVLAADVTGKRTSREQTTRTDGLGSAAEGKLCRRAFGR